MTFKGEKKKTLLLLRSGVNIYTPTSQRLEQWSDTHTEHSVPIIHFFFWKAIGAVVIFYSIRSKHVATKAKHTSAIIPPILDEKKALRS